LPKLVVLRLGHRPGRDKRLTTHVGLVARAFGADGVIISDVRDKSVELSIQNVVENWGGPFFIKTGEPWRKTIDEWKRAGGQVVHLTMYGIPVQDKIEEIRKSESNKLVVVGAEKVPREIFDLADHNVSVTQQPHSEAAALAVFLHMFFNGEELYKKFSNARLSVAPQERGKVVVEAA